MRVIIPWRGGCPHRQTALGWVRARYERLGWEIVLAEIEGPWVKARAVMPTLERLDDEIVVVADADVWCRGLRQALAAVIDGKTWAVPHRYIHRLTSEATERVLAGGPARNEQLEESYRVVEGGGIVIARREALLEVPLDPRFVGWGGEDCAWGCALRSIFGRPWLGVEPLIHLWHPPQEGVSRPLRPNHYWASEENEALRLDYVRARSHPAKTRELIAGGRSHA